MHPKLPEPTRTKISRRSISGGLDAGMLDAAGNGVRREVVVTELIAGDLRVLPARERFDACAWRDAI